MPLKRALSHAILLTVNYRLLYQTICSIGKMITSCYNQRLLTEKQNYLDSTCNMIRKEKVTLLQHFLMDVNV